MRVLVTGASGFLGDVVRRRLAREHAVTGTRHAHGGSDGALVPVDLTGAHARLAVLEHARPNIIVHCAGLTSPVECERCPDLARQLNTDVTAALADWAARNSVRLVVVSTDQVFDGTSAPYAEDAKPTPLHVYGRTKSEGDRATLAASPEFTVVRVPLLYGRSGGRKLGADHDVLAQLRRGGHVAIVDEYRTPTWVEDVADGIAVLLRRPTPGVLHFASRSRVSRYEFARLVARTTGLPDALVAPRRGAEFAASYPRAPDTSLLATRALDELDLQFHSLGAGLAASLRDA